MVRIALILSIFLVASGLGAQETAAYVSRLTALAGSRSVLLTWKDAEGWPDAQYEIWRSEKEIVKDSLSQAKLLATVKSGVEAYEDTAVLAPSFYLVLLKDSSGVRRGFYIPYRNKTITAVKPDGTAPQSTALVKVGSVTYANPQILIPFSAYPPDRKLVVFRRASPITSLSDLKDATLLGNTTGAASPWRDSPSPGLEFYYAVLDAQAYADARSDAFQVENATERPAGFPLVALPPSVEAANLDSRLRPDLDLSTRALPLPRLQVGTEPDSGSPMAPTAYDPVQAQPLASEPQLVLKKWAKSSSTVAVTLPQPVVLAEERSAAQPGAARYLVQIQKAYLEPRDWKGAVGALETVLKLTLDPRTEARARFYLGEALAYQKNYRQAFVEFLSARDTYPTEVNPFLQALFSLLAAMPE